MIVNAKLSIGYPGAMQEEELEIDDSALEGLTPEQCEDVINEQVEQWANEHIEYWYEGGEEE